MSLQFKRVYELTIQPPEGEARVIKDLRISFEVTKSVLSFPNLARITLFNPNPDTLAALEKKFTKVILSAGYEGSSRLIFKGEVRNSFIGRLRENRQVTIYAGDGQRSWQNSTFSKTFSENVTIASAVKDIVASLEGLATGVFEGVPEVADKLRGQTLVGASKDILDTLASEYGFNWSIQDEAVNVVPTNKPITQTQAVLVTSTTGMIGSPTITEIGADVTTLLNPEFQPDGIIKIEAEGAEASLGNLFFRDVKRTVATGFYKIQEVAFRGDSREGDWLSAVKGITFNV